jgi:hypothetical protein
LIVIFPLEETFFTPANSKDPEHDRVIVPVQLLSLALASARGYLAALSGDFSAFDRHARQLTAQIETDAKDLKKEKDPDIRAAIETDRKQAALQLEALPLEREQLKALGKALEKILGFAGEKEMDLNQELAARRNALVLRLQLAQLAPFLVGVELGGVRLIKDKRDGSGENFLAIDLEAKLDKFEPPRISSPTAGPVAAAAPPLVIMRLNQSFFESEAVVGAEARDVGGKIRRLALEFHEDGLHVKGRWRVALLPDVPFKAVVDFNTTEPNVFEITVRDVSVAHIDLEALTPLVLSVVSKRLNNAFVGACSFEDAGLRTIRARVDMKKLMPSFPALALTKVDVKEGEFLLKAGKP